MMRRTYRLDDVVQMKKKHPCGNDSWVVMRVGADFRIKCTGCGRVVMLPRAKFEKSVKRIVSSRYGLPESGQAATDSKEHADLPEPTDDSGSTGG